MGDFKGQLDSYPIAEQLIAKDKIIANEKPDDFALWNEVGLLSQYLKRYDAARESYLKISELLPNDFGGFLGIAAADLGRADSEKSDLINNRGISPTEDIALNPQNKDVCDTLKEKTRAIFEEGYANAKRAIQLQPNDGFSYRVLSLIAHHKSWIECGDPVTAKADNDEGDQLAKLSEEKSEAAMMRRDSNLRKVVVALGPPGPMGAIGGVIGNIISQNLVSPRPVVGDPGSVAVASGIQSGLLISKVNPIYPPLAREARIQGLVLLAAQISKKGEVESLQLISGHPMLAPAAIDAVKQWKYRPYLRNGSPVKVRTVIQVNFALSRQ
jgi:TonB family protein